MSGKPLEELIAVTLLVIDALEAPGMLKVQGDRLDYAYLGHWAVQLGVIDLLEPALAEAGVA